MPLLKAGRFVTDELAGAGATTRRARRRAGSSSRLPGCWPRLPPSPAFTGQLGVRVEPGQRVEQLEPWLARLELVALSFPGFHRRPRLQHGAHPARALPLRGRDPRRRRRARSTATSSCASAASTRSRSPTSAPLASWADAHVEMQPHLPAGLCRAARCRGGLARSAGDAGPGRGVDAANWRAAWPCAVVRAPAPPVTSTCSSSAAAWSSRPTRWTSCGDRCQRWAPRSFRPGDRPLPPGTDRSAERRGFCRGSTRCDCAPP